MVAELFVAVVMGLKLQIFKIFRPPLSSSKRQKRIIRGVASIYIVTTDFNPLVIKRDKKRTIGSAYMAHTKWQILQRGNMYRAGGAPCVSYALFSTG